MSRNGEYGGVRVVGKRSISSKMGRCCSGCDDGRDLSDSDDERPRGCTDIIALMVYVIFCLVMIVIAIFAIFYGNPYRLINGVDSFGNICGTKNAMDGNMTFNGLDMSGKPYVFFFDPARMDVSTKICVEQCPEDGIQDFKSLQEFYNNTSVNLCQYDYDLSNATQQDTKPSSKNFVESLCPKLAYPPTIPLLRRCIAKPNSMKTKSGVSYREFGIGYLNDLDIFKQILGNLAVTWTVVLDLTAGAFVIAFILLCGIHWMTSSISYIIFGATSVLSIAFTGCLWWTFAHLKSMLDLEPDREILEESANNERAFLAYSIISTIFTIILLLVIFYLRNRLKLVIQLFKEASRSLRAMPCLILQPLITFISLALFFLGWLLIVVCLATSDYETSRRVLVVGDEDSIIGYNDTVGHDFEHHHNSEEELSGVSMNRTILSNDISATTLIEYTEGVWVKYMWWIYLIGLIWCSEFILACQQMVIASSISTWYFSRDRTKLKWVVLQSVRRLVKYHLGSVALGSLIITFLKVPRLIFSFLERVLKRWEKYNCARGMNNCCKPCFDWLKKIHHNAYTVISIQCINFCPASRLASSAVASNAHISVVNSVGDFVLFLAKCITAGLTGLIAVIVFWSDGSLYFYAIPVLLTVVFAYFVAHSVISVYEMAVDTLFLCYCEDYNMNEETQNFFAPGSLLQFMRDDPRGVTLGRQFDEAGPIPIKQGIHESSTAEERHPMNVIRA